MQQTNPLTEICSPKSANYDSEFVGVHYDNGKFEIVFPIGYKLSEDDEEIRKDVLNLLKVLREYRNSDKTKASQDNQENDLQDFPLYSYIYVFNYFRKNGYYTTKETIYKNSTKGKVNWNRTIKQTKPIVDNGNVVYLNTITRNINYSDEELISQINKYCVYESFEKIGCLFTNFKLQNPHIKFNKNLFVSFLKRKIAETFHDDDRFLFKNMLDIIEQKNRNDETREYFYGTKEFHWIWEKMIDDVYGSKKDSADLHPHIYWQIEGKKHLTSTLIPDTIMFSKDKTKAYILDAKYYKAGEDKNGHLPSSESVPKQLVYAERIKETMNFEDKNIYNAFILPYRSENGKTIEYLGFTYPDWKKTEIINSIPYYRIQGIKLDVKNLMQNHSVATDSVFDEMKNMIEENCKNKFVK